MAIISYFYKEKIIIFNFQIQCFISFNCLFSDTDQHDSFPFLQRKKSHLSPLFACLIEWIKFPDVML